MKYSYSEWNHKQGTIPVHWKPSDYEDLPWYENPDKDQGFTTPKENYDIYKERVGCLIPKFEQVGKGVFIPEDVDRIFGYVLSQFDLENAAATKEREDMKIVSMIASNNDMDSAVRAKANERLLAWLDNSK